MDDLSELLIDASTFPPDWQQDGGIQELDYQIIPREAQKGLWIQFVPRDDGARATHAVYLFPDSDVAARAFRRGRELGLNDADRVTPWESPDWMTYQSSAADQQRVDCASFFGGYPEVSSKYCLFAGQYGRYISTFSISLSPPESVVSYAELVERAVQAIDARMESRTEL